MCNRQMVKKKKIHTERFTRLLKTICAEQKESKLRNRWKLSMY